MVRYIINTFGFRFPAPTKIPNAAQVGGASLNLSPWMAAGSAKAEKESKLGRYPEGEAARRGFREVEREENSLHRKNRFNDSTVQLRDSSKLSQIEFLAWALSLVVAQLLAQPFPGL